MRVKDEQLWTQQLQELEADEASRLFRDFLLTWAYLVEKDLDGRWPKQRHEFIREAAGKAFEEIEASLGFISVEWIGSMLLLLVQHWTYGEMMWDSLSVWERRMVEQATALKFAELMDLAEGDDGGQPSVEGEV